jgi:hypothetical protein
MNYNLIDKIIIKYVKPFVNIMFIIMALILMIKVIKYLFSILYRG